jgi:hypothetical protein
MTTTEAIIVATTVRVDIRLTRRGRRQPQSFHQRPQTQRGKGVVPQDVVGPHPASAATADQLAQAVSNAKAVVFFMLPRGG